MHRYKGPARNNQQDQITNVVSSLVEDHVTRMAVEGQNKRTCMSVCVGVCVCDDGVLTGNDIL